MQVIRVRMQKAVLKIRKLDTVVKTVIPTMLDRNAKKVRYIVMAFFNNSDAVLNFEHIAMQCGLSRVIALFWTDKCSENKENPRKINKSE